MTPEEKDRLVEVLLYLYFNNLDSKIIEKEEFWKSIKNICELYRIESLAISKSVRILLAPENMPREDEVYYLLNKMGLSVRQIKNISGIYWQKQKKFDELFKNSSTPVVKRRILDIVIKKNIRDFFIALYNVLGIFGYIEKNILEDTL